MPFFSHYFILVLVSDNINGKKKHLWNLSVLKNMYVSTESRREANREAAETGSRMQIGHSAVIYEALT